MGISYGFGDTVSYTSIPLIVGKDRAGKGFGIYVVIGSLVSLLIPLGAGYFLSISGPAMVSFFGVLTLVGALLWVIIYFLEGPKSRLETPTRLLVETEKKDVDASSLVSIIGKGDNS